MSIKKYHYNYLKQFMKNDLTNIEIINGVPKVVYIFWFSHLEHIPEFTIRRFNALQSLINNIKIPVIIITQENYKFWILKEHPLVKSFKYLSGVHKSDYLRVYILYHYGGGYHDIKWREKSWENEWNKFENNNIWFIGRREFKKEQIGYNPFLYEKTIQEQYLKTIQEQYSKMITMSWIISKPYNNCMKIMLHEIETILNNKLTELELNPAPISRCGIGVGCNENEYPLRWLEILGEIFHPLILNYTEHIDYTLPDILYKTYK